MLGDRYPRQPAWLRTLQLVVQAVDVRQLEDGANRWAAQVRVNQQYAAAVRFAQREREIARRQRLALAGDGARHHDDTGAALRLRVVQRCGELAVLLDERSGV